MPAQDQTWSKSSPASTVSVQTSNRTPSPITPARISAARSDSDRSRTSIRLLVADSSPLLRAGISAAIGPHADLDLVAEAQDGKEAVELALKHRPDVALIDAQLQEVGAVEVAQSIHDALPRTRILLLVGTIGHSHLKGALQAGTTGFLLKSATVDVLIETIRRVNHGHQVIPADLAVDLATRFTDKDLSSREIEVLRLVAVGSPNKRIALVLDVTVDTVKAHMKGILSKLSANDRTHAVTLALRRGLIQLDD